MKLSELIGKKIAAVKGYPPQSQRDKRYIEPAFFLFDDGETVLELQEQDYYTFHDCSTMARLLSAYADGEKWARFMTFPDANSNL